MFNIILPQTNCIYYIRNCFYIYLFEYLLLKENVPLTCFLHFMGTSDINILLYYY